MVPFLSTHYFRAFCWLSVLHGCRNGPNPQNMGSSSNAAWTYSFPSLSLPLLTVQALHQCCSLDSFRHITLAAAPRNSLVYRDCWIFFGSSLPYMWSVTTLAVSCDVPSKVCQETDLFRQGVLQMNSHFVQDIWDLIACIFLKKKKVFFVLVEVQTSLLPKADFYPSSVSKNILSSPFFLLIIGPKGSLRNTEKIKILDG